MEARYTLSTTIQSNQVGAKSIPDNPTNAVEAATLRYMTEGCKLPPYMAIPKAVLARTSINETAKIVYTMLLDRAKLSLQNDGWVDGQGHVYIIYTIASLAQAVKKSEMTVKTALAALERDGLIRRKRQGPGMPNRIYVMVPVVPDQDSKLAARGTADQPREGNKTVPVRASNMSGSNNDSSNVIQQQDGINGARTAHGSYSNVILTPDELRELRRDIPGYMQYIERLSCYMASSGKTYANHAATIRHWASRDNNIALAQRYTYSPRDSL